MTIYIATLLGLLIGSFLNVCIYRVPRKLSVVSPARSYCPKCERQLSWYENIPVLSWLIQLAKCRGCGQPISGQYPLVEILSAIAGAATFLKYGATPSSLIIFLLTESLIVITFIDLEFRIIPNVISFPGITLGLILGIVSQYTNLLAEPVTQSALDSLIGMLVGGGFFYVIGVFYYWISKRVGLGGGDIKLMGMVGAILGWRAIAPTIFAGSIFGSIVGIAAMLFTGQGRQTEIPFGPWLALGTILYLFADLPFFRF